MTEFEQYGSVFKKCKCCVLIPTYNNAATLPDVIRDVMRYTDDIVVVNDGSTDNTLEILKQFASIRLLTYPRNRGKGWALRRGFELARDKGYDYAITIDSDGQHYADDLPVFLDALTKDPDVIYIGARNMDQSSVPGRSSFGNKFSNFWFRFETGIDLPDTQSGYRLYPLRLLQKIHFFTLKYEFEVEVIVRAAWRDIDVRCLPVRVFYPPADERISHFRPFRDFSRISVLNTVLVFYALIWIKPRNLFRYILGQNVKTLIQEYLIKSEEPAGVKAMSVAVGIFFGIAPFWGAQMFLALTVAWTFKLNKAMAILISNISIPPMIPVILYASYRTGGAVLAGDASDDMLRSNAFLGFIDRWLAHVIRSFNISDSELAARIVRNMTQYIVGSFVLATISALVMGLITYFLVKILKKN